MSQPQRSSPRHPIRVVSQRTGLKATLIRAWERRHSAIEPHRTFGNHRLYSDAHIDRLILLRRATEGGRGIGQLAAMSDEALRQLIEEDAVASGAVLEPATVVAEASPRLDDPGAGAGQRVEACLAATLELDHRELAFLLERAMVELGPVPALAEVVAPLMYEIGERWRQARLRPMHEHLAATVVRSLIDELIRHQQPAVGAPAILVTTPSGQHHEIGALLAAAMAAVEGWRVTFLGSDLPAEEIVAAALEIDVRAVALSLVYPVDDPRIGQQIRRLRRQLGPQIDILVGGPAVPGYEVYLEEIGAIHTADLAAMKSALHALRRDDGDRLEAVRPMRASGRRRPLAAPAVGQVTHPRLLVSRRACERFQIDQKWLSPEGGLWLADPEDIRQLAVELNAQRNGGGPARGFRAGQMYAFGMIQELDRRWLSSYRQELNPDVMLRALATLEGSHGNAVVDRALRQFADLYPVGGGVTSPTWRSYLLEQMLVLWLSNDNPAIGLLRDLFDDTELQASTGYRQIVADLELFFRQEPAFGPDGESLLDLLRSPIHEHPESLAGQLQAMLHIQDRLSQMLSSRVLRALDILREEERPIFPGPGAPAPAKPSTSRPFRPFVEKPWMVELVLIAKHIKIWLHQLTDHYGQSIRRLDEIPEAELDRLASWGISGLWLIGIWQRSAASRRIKEGRGLPASIASAYAIDEYLMAEDLGGEAALAVLEQRATARGIRLACDFVPNHMGLDSRWLVEWPERFLAVERSPFPGYSFTGEDLSSDARVGIYLEDHYEDESDAAVVFKRVDRQTGEVRYVYHGNDGTGLPWNDTAQLNYLEPAVREAAITTLVEVARRFPVIRIDAAMTLIKQHIQRLWFPEAGQGGAIPSRSEHGLEKEAFDLQMPRELWREVVERLAAEAPGTLLLAEGYWQMESYLVQDLGMHRVYHSAFMHMLRDELNSEFRASLESLLESDRRMLAGFVNYLTNPDERTAAEQLGKGDKYFALATLLATLPGLPLLGHGQIEGLVEPYKMDAGQAQYSETPDRQLISRHEREIVPLLARRRLFAGTADFRLYNFKASDPRSAGSRICDDVFCFSNGAAGSPVLVVVHNRRATVRGRVQHCVPYRDVERGVMKGETLADILGLAPAADSFCCFRDVQRGLEFIYASREICERGLALDLGPYDYRVLGDFREVRDSDGRWQRLAAELGGRGVADLARARG